MHAAVRRYEVNPDVADRVISRIVEDFAPLLTKEVEGLRAYYVLDAGDGAFATMVFCDSQAALEQCITMATDWTRQYLVDSIRSAEDFSKLFVKVGEILEGVLHEGAQQQLPTNQLPQEPETKEHLRRANERPVLLSPSEVGQELGMGRSWVYKQIRSGEIPSVRLGNNIKVRGQDLEEYLRAQQYRRARDN